MLGSVASFLFLLTAIIIVFVATVVLGPHCHSAGVPPLPLTWGLRSLHKPVPSAVGLSRIAQELSLEHRGIITKLHLKKQFNSQLHRPACGVSFLISVLKCHPRPPRSCVSCDSEQAQVAAEGPEVLHLPQRSQGKILSLTCPQGPHEARTGVARHGAPAWAS